MKAIQGSFKHFVTYSSLFQKSCVNLLLFAILPFPILGHSAEFEPEDELMLQLTDVPHREGMYKLHDFHLHYGGVTGRDFELQVQEHL